jgi:hypothetical protein
MRKLKKIVFTLNIGDYAPELCELTYPYMQGYAEKIGAEFYIIKERKFPEFPPVYEKLQIKDIMEERGADWAIYIDSDVLVHPDLFDVTNHLRKDTVMHWGTDLASNRWEYDEYFLRDGRNIGSCNWFTVASDWCLDLWQPLDISFEEAKERISLTQVEKSSGVFDTSHLIDDYTLSRNIARYGLKVKTFKNLCVELTNEEVAYFWHSCLTPVETKVATAKQVIADWESEERVSSTQYLNFRDK